MVTSARLRKYEAELGELLEVHERSKKDRRNFKRYANDPVGFITRVLDGDKMWEKQCEIAELVRDNPFVVVRSANSIGKDWLAARLALWWVYACDGRALLMGPTRVQVEEILIRKEIGAAFHSAKLPGELLTQALRRRPGGKADVLARTSTDVGKLSGFHGDRVLVIITEAEECEDIAFEAAMANATGPHDRVLAVGNPLHPRGRFYTINRPEARNWVKVKIRADEHPNVVQGREVIPGGPSREWMERQRTEYGSDSPFYIAHVLADFPEEDTDSLVQRAWLERAVENFESGRFTQESLKSGWRIGLDVATYGDDSTCLTFRRGPVLKELLTWRGASTMQTVGRVIRELSDRHLEPTTERNPLFAPTDMTQYGPGIGTTNFSIHVDIIGLGQGVLDRLVEQGWPAHGFHASAKARKPKRFVNRRAEIYWRLRIKLERGEIAFPRDEDLFEELLATRYVVDSSGKVQIEAKKDLKKRLGRSPDRADSVAYAFGTDDRTSGGGVMLDL